MRSRLLDHTPIGVSGSPSKQGRMMSSYYMLECREEGSDFWFIPRPAADLRHPTVEAAERAAPFLNKTMGMTRRGGGWEWRVVRVTAEPVKEVDLG